MNETRTFEIRFVAIEVVSKAITDPPMNLEDFETFNFNFTVDMKVFPKQKTAGVETIVKIYLAKDMKEVGTFKTLCGFELPDFNNVFTKITDNKYDTPMELEIILKSSSLSTSRGVVAAECKGTYLQGAVLPLIDMNALIRNQRKQQSIDTIIGSTKTENKD